MLKQLCRTNITITYHFKTMTLISTKDLGSSTLPQRKQTNLNTMLTYPAAQWLPTIVAIVTESNNKWECFLNHVGTILYKLGGLNPTLIETEMCVIRTKKKTQKTTTLLKRFQNKCVKVLRLPLDDMVSFDSDFLLYFLLKRSLDVQSLRSFVKTLAIPKSTMSNTVATFVIHLRRIKLQHFDFPNEFLFLEGSWM